MVVTLDRFTADDETRFADYRRLKYEIFVVEQGWPLASSAGAVLPDFADPVAHFVLARNEKGRAIGIVRANFVRDAFPHHELFDRHRTALACLWDKLATVNALAVLPEYRGRAVTVAGRTRPLTTAKALVAELVDELRDRGASAIVLSTGIGNRTVFMAHLGFYLIDAPYRHESGHVLVNLGLIVDDRQRFAAVSSPLAEHCPRRSLSSAEQALLRYFLHWDASILGGRSVEDYARDPTPVSQAAIIPPSSGR